MRIYKRGRVYWLDIYIQGKRLRRSLKTTNKERAHDRYRQWWEAVQKTTETGDILFDDLCAQYIRYAWQEKPASALREEQRLEKIKTHFKGLGIQYLSEITPLQLDQLKALLKDGKIPGMKQKLSKATVNRYMQILRCMFNKAISWGIYNRSNPLQKVRFYKESSPVRPLEQDDIAKIMKTSAEISRSPKSHLQVVWHDLVILALNTGMRKSEILNLKWNEVRGNEFLEIKGKGGKKRTIPLNNRALEIIKKQPRHGVFVFDIPNRHQHDVFRRTVAQVREKTGVYQFHFHLLRHRFTTQLLQKGVDLVTVSDILGHSKTYISLIYGHTDQSKKHEAVLKLED